MALGLTRRQAQALCFIAGYIEANGRSPSQVEISEGLGVEGNSYGRNLVNALEERGRLTRKRSALTAGSPHRSIKLLTPVAIPRAPDGAPLYLTRAAEKVTVVV